MRGRVCARATRKETRITNERRREHCCQVRASGMTRYRGTPLVNDGILSGNRLGESRLGTSRCRGSLVSLKEKKNSKVRNYFCYLYRREKELSERAAALIFPASPVDAIADVNTASWTQMLLLLLEILFSILEGEASR